jgi:hypothetical protein
MEYFNLVSILSQSVVQNLPKNLLSRSEMMEVGNPKCTQIWLKNSSVASHLEIVFLQGVRTHILLKRSTTTNK